MLQFVTRNKLPSNTDSTKRNVAEWMKKRKNSFKLIDARKLQKIGKRRSLENNRHLLLFMCITTLQILDYSRKVVKLRLSLATFIWFRISTEHLDMRSEKNFSAPDLIFDHLLSSDGRWVAYQTVKFISATCLFTYNHSTHLGRYVFHWLLKLKST